MSKHVAEIVTFKLAEGVSEAEFIVLSQASESFVRAQPGFVHRQLSCGEDGRWTDYVIWADMETAKSVAAEFHKQDFCASLMQAIAEGTAQMRHEEVQWSMAS
ncbi:hypothetical protein VWZ88_17905 [Phaeobacter sp. JH20_36]|uniref:antibiotic biosynthesis monooxygenase family protein n=1 Tax=Phaeobacter TaxID=302485 RepID=UPI003A8BC474